MDCSKSLSNSCSFFSLLKKYTLSISMIFSPLKRTTILDELLQRSPCDLTQKKLRENTRPNILLLSGSDVGRKTTDPPLTSRDEKWWVAWLSQHNVNPLSSPSPQINCYFISTHPPWLYLPHAFQHLTAHSEFTCWGEPRSACILPYYISLCAYFKDSVKININGCCLCFSTMTHPITLSDCLAEQCSWRHAYVPETIVARW